MEWKILLGFILLIALRTLMEFKVMEDILKGMLIIFLFGIVWAVAHFFIIPKLSEHQILTIFYIVAMMPLYSIVRYLIGFIVRIPSIPILLESSRTFVVFSIGIIIGLESKIMAIYFLTIIIAWTAISLIFGLASFGDVFFDAFSIRSYKEKKAIKEFQEIVKQRV